MEHFSLKHGLLMLAQKKARESTPFSLNFFMKEESSKEDFSYIMRP